MPDVNVYEAFKELIQRLFSGDEEVAELAATDPEGLLAAYGITESSLDGVNFRQAVGDSYHDYDLPEGTRQALQSYVAGGPAPAHYQVATPPAHPDGYQSPEHAVQHLQYVTYAAFDQNTHITQEIVNQQLLVDSSDNRVFHVDNSTEVSVDVGRDFDGDPIVTPANTTTVAGDGAVQGERIGVANTGENTGLLADGPVENAVVGEGNQTANLDINTAGGRAGDGTGGDGTGGLNDARLEGFEDLRESGTDASGTGGAGTGGDASGGAVGPINLNFGSGDQSFTEVDGNVDNSALAGTGTAGNVADNRVDDGSALVTGDGGRLVELEPQPVEQEAEVERGLVEALSPAQDSRSLDDLQDEVLGG